MTPDAISTSNSMPTKPTGRFAIEMTADSLLLPRHQPPNGASRQEIKGTSLVATFARTWATLGIPYVLANAATISPTKKARCLCDTGLLKAPVGKSIRCHCLRRYGCEFVLEMVSIFCDGQPTTAGTPTTTANRLLNPNWAARSCRPVVTSSFCQSRLTILCSQIPGTTPRSSVLSIGCTANRAFTNLIKDAH